MNAENEAWLTRWQNGQTGWHEHNGNAALGKFWPRLSANSRVLVPLCGKSTDLLWLEQQGFDVTGVELSEIAASTFFADADIPFEVESDGRLARFQALKRKLSIHCGDYFKFRAEPFDAIYDRAALVAVPPGLRPASAPTMFGVHSPDEKLQISTVPEFYNQLVNVLKNIPSK